MLTFETASALFEIIGASKSYIMMLLSREFLTLIVIANIIAWPVAYIIMGKLLDNYAYKTNVSIWIFILTSILILLLAFLTIVLQIFKAARTNPAETLRYE